MGRRVVVEEALHLVSELGLDVRLHELGRPPGNVAPRKQHHRALRKPSILAVHQVTLGGDRLVSHDRVEGLERSCVRTLNVGEGRARLGRDPLGCFTTEQAKHQPMPCVGIESIATFGHAMGENNKEQFHGLCVLSRVAPHGRRVRLRRILGGILLISDFGRPTREPQRRGHRSVRARLSRARINSLGQKFHIRHM